MAKYELRLKLSAEKDLNKLNIALVDRILDKLELLLDDPRPRSAKKLKGEISYRLRIGDYRAVYEVDDSKKLILVFKIRHRKDVYK